MKILICILFLFFNVALARLAPTQFKKFISESEVILDATPMKAEWKEHSSGFAEFRINRVMKGDYKEPSVQIVWSTEVHDQAIDNMGVDWILFLKKDKDGKYTGTHYGRSYWPLTTRVMDSEKGRSNLEWDGRGTFYEYPITMLEIASTTKKNLFSKRKNKYNKSVDFISVKSLMKTLSQSPQSGNQ